MSKEIDFNIQVRCVGAGKLGLIHDSGQGANEILVTLGNESRVVSPSELANAARRAYELIAGDEGEHQVRVNKDPQKPEIMMFGHGDGPSRNGNIYGPGVRQQMPPLPLQHRPPPPAPTQTYDRDDK